ncbi:histidine kinase dimerization/phosphoacceptor domain -containing protein [Bosea sp. (in: a-proteobacteria)]|uniref:histidine kinase dimerization/phosphoacceptor domain -containing protein n=1 Tax=Bosea sp. (in: a-proteobacteria) TaxID=1871050 RepID=UPI002FCC0C95
MALSLFRTVRGRLLALMVAIALPIAALTAAAAVSTYRTVLDAIQTSQARTADDYAVRARVWYRGALRSLLSTSAAFAALPPELAPDCRRLGDVLRSTTGYLALHIAVPGRAPCSASLDPQVSEADLARISAQMQEKPAVPVWGGSETAEARYGQVDLHGRHFLAIHARHPHAGSDGAALLLASPDLLSNVFDLGTADPGLIVGMVSRSSGIVSQRGGSQGDENWLPRDEVAPEEIQRWRGASRAGGGHSYAARMVVAPDLYVIASFDQAAERAATLQFYALLLAPLLTLALLCIVYLKAVDQHCVRWLRGIEAAARARHTLSSAHAPLSEEMPRDIRSVAEAFNTMVDEQEIRQRKLQAALNDNRFLVRELHHRVKNSLQVVQSYIGLTKRDHRGEARLALSDAECRVHVLSAAYRFTLADGEMQPVRIDLFLDDVVAMIASLVRSRTQWVTGQVETVAALPIDRIIPLGFLIVDVVSRTLRAVPGIGITIAVTDFDEDTIEVAITADRETPPIPPPRLFAGLLTQVEAVEVSPAEGASLGIWRIRHRD